MTWFNPAPADLAAAGVPRPDGPTVRVAGAPAAVEGRDYRELTSLVNEDLNADNGQYFDGVTDDGLVLFRDGPRAGQLYPRFALLDPETGEKDWLPDIQMGQAQTRAVELSEDRLVLVALGEAVAYVFDRDSREWSGVKWPAVSRKPEARPVDIGPDGRLYVLVPATHGSPPPGGWPTGPDGEADDADADGDTFDLWSVDPADGMDARDEHLRVGSIGFTDDSLVWTDSSNGAAGMVHVRSLATGEETSFDPELGERCNLLGFDVSGDRIAMTQYCGTYDGVRDDRVQVVTTDGEQVVTIQDDGLDAGDLVGGGDYLTLASYDRATVGTYLYDFAEGRLLRLTDSRSAWALGQGPAPGDEFLWDTAAGGVDEMFGRSGAEVHLGEIIR